MVLKFLLRVSHRVGLLVAELDVSEVEGDDGLAEPELPGERPEDGGAAAGQLALAWGNIHV